jgi:hypothetical protein
MSGPGGTVPKSAWWFGEWLAATLRLDRKLAELELADDPAEARALPVL